MRILILGGNGMIGHKMYQVLSEQFADTWVLMRKTLDELPFKDIYQQERVIDGIDVTDFEGLRTILDHISPTIIINAIGITIRRGINDQVSKSIEVNAALPHFLEEWVNLESNKRLIHFSTDCVFSGNSGSYTEESYTDAKDYYGKTKALGEVGGSQSLTLRGSMIGRELENYTELLEWFLSQKDAALNGFEKVIYSGITTVQMAKFVKAIIIKHPKMNGIYNVSSVPISKYQLLNLFNEAFNINAEIAINKDYESRKDLISDKFYNTTGLHIPKWEDLVIQLKQDSLKYSKYYKN